MSAAKKPVKKPAARAASVYKVVKQFESGVRAHCTSVIPAAGATIEQIGALLKKKHDIDPKKAKGYVSWLSANGFVKRVA
jgi:hypothetical protein